jgi:uncharacterized Zn finger protein
MKEKTYCDCCGREQKVYEVILSYESGRAYYCEDCIKNNPYDKNTFIGVQIVK